MNARLPRKPSGTALGVAVLLLATAIAGCSGDGNEAPSVGCPRVSVLADAATLTRFASETGRDLLDVDYRAEVTDLFAGCRVVTDEVGESVLLVAVVPEIRASRGPANESRQAEFTYFVSVVEDGSTILNKATFPVSLRFEGNRRQLIYRDDNPPVTVDLPWRATSDVDSYEVVLGFQLTQADLDYNREVLEGRR